MKQILLALALDLVTGLAATIAVILATDSTGADLRVYMVSAVVLFFAAGFWRGRAQPWLVWLRPLLIALVPIVLAVQMVARHWPPDARGIVYALLFPLLNWGAAATGLLLSRRRGFTGGLRAVTLGSLLVATVLVAAVAMPPFSRWLTTYDMTGPVPGFSFESLDGREVNSRDWRGKVVVLDFWASWCLPCRAELAELDALDDRYRDREDVIFWAVAARDDREQADAFARAQAYSLRWGWDSGDRAFDALKATTVPSLYLIDRQGRIRLNHVGYSAAEGFVEHFGARVDQVVAEE